MTATLFQKLIVYVSHVRALGVRQTLQYVVQRLRGAQIIALTVPGIRTPVFLRVSGSDTWVLWQALKGRDFDITLQNSPRLIIDGGANIGLASLFFANKWPDAQIIAIEPDPENCALLHKNCAAYSNIEIIQGALWPSNAELVVQNPDDFSFAFRVVEASSSTSSSFTGVTVNDILDNSDKQCIDLLKLDIEGSEEQLFTFGYSNWLSRTKNIMIEIHGQRCRKVVLDGLKNQHFAPHKSGEYDVFTRV
jgi:FkbM family methyltransferase